MSIWKLSSKERWNIFKCILINTVRNILKLNFRIILLWLMSLYICFSTRAFVRTLICGCSLLYKRELWASKSAGAHSDKSLKISRCKRWCPEKLRVRAPAAPGLTHSLWMNGSPKVSLPTLMTLMCKRMMMSKLSKEKSCRPFGIWLAIRLWSESYVYILHM